MYTQQNKAAQQQQKQPFINEKERDRARQQKKTQHIRTNFMRGIYPIFIFI